LVEKKCWRERDDEVKVLTAKGLFLRFCSFVEAPESSTASIAGGYKREYAHRRGLESALSTLMVGI
jgi:hypothetical protein